MNLNLIKINLNKLYLSNIKILNKSAKLFEYLILKPETI